MIYDYPPLLTITSYLPEGWISQLYTIFPVTSTNNKKWIKLNLNNHKTQQQKAKNKYTDPVCFQLNAMERQVLAAPADLTGRGREPGGSSSSLGSDLQR